MKFLLISGIIATFCASSVLTDNASKVKLTGAKVLSFDTLYFNKFKLGVEPGNATQNYLYIAYDLMKDMPADTQTVIQVYRSNLGSNAKCLNYQRIQGFSVSLCSDQNSKYNQYLADSQQLLKKSKECGLKKKYENNRSDYVKFYNLLTEDQLKDGCFKTINGLVSGGKYLYKEELDFLPN